MHVSQPSDWWEGRKNNSLLRIGTTRSSGLEVWIQCDPKNSGWQYPQVVGRSQHKSSRNMGFIILKYHSYTRPLVASELLPVQMWRKSRITKLIPNGNRFRESVAYRWQSRWLDSCYLWHGENPSTPQFYNFIIIIIAPSSSMCSKSLVRKYKESTHLDIFWIAMVIFS